MWACVFVWKSLKHIEVKQFLYPPSQALCTSGQTYSDDVKKVVVSKSVQYGGDGLPGDGQPEAFHAATDIHQDDHILWRGGSLDVPLPVTTVKSYDPVFIWLPLDPLKTQSASLVKDKQGTAIVLELHNLYTRKTYCHPG